VIHQLKSKIQLTLCLIFTASLWMPNLTAQHQLTKSGLTLEITPLEGQIIKPNSNTHFELNIFNQSDIAYSNITLKGESCTWGKENKIQQFEFLTNQFEDPNQNNQLDPHETWTVKVNRSFEFEKAGSFIVKAGVVAQQGAARQLAADAILVHGVSSNVEIITDVNSVQAGGTVQVELISRLLIDEDAAKEPGYTIINVGGVDIMLPLPETHWEARDALISSGGLNNENYFDPFNQPAGVNLNNFCVQSADQGRNTNNILDECEPIDSFRAPCTAMGEDDVLCDFPDWHFCYELTIPSDFPGPTYQLIASDSFQIWQANEEPAGSGNFTSFSNITNITGGLQADTLDIDVEPLGCNSPPALDNVENLTGTSTQLFWIAVPGADKYRIQYRELGTTTWSLKSNSNTTVILNDLTPETDYEFRFASRCGTWGNYGTIYTFTSSGCVSPNTDYTESLNGSIQTVVLIAVPDASKYQIRYRAVGSASWAIKNFTGGDVSRNLINLTPGTEYEFEKRTQCLSGKYTAFSSPDFFTTSTCDSPAPIGVTFPNTGQALVEWEAQENAVNYQIRYRIAGDPNWTVRASTTPMRTLTDLIAGSTYLYQLRAKCPSWTAWSSNYSFATPNTITGEIIDSRSATSDFDIYPNPVNGKEIFITVDHSELQEASLIIFDMNGKVVRQSMVIDADENLISIDHLAAGQYFVQLNTINSSTTKRFFKVK